MKKGIIFIFGLMILFGIMFAYAQDEFPFGGDVGTGGGSIGGELQTPGSGIEGIILKISSVFNAHGEMFNGTGDYPIEIRYNTTFGHIYPRLDFMALLSFNPTYPHTTCTGTNKILRLSGTTNAHAESPAKTTAGYRDICYGNLICRYVANGDCNSAEGEKCVVALSADTNAHLSMCPLPATLSGTLIPGLPTPYYNRICCKEKCPTFPDKNGCWQVPEYGCTWTPVTNLTGGKILTEAQGGGCCPNGRIWKDGGCQSTDMSTPCTIPFTDTIALNPKNTANLYSSDGPLDKTKKQYCAQVTAGVNTGYWYDPTVY